MSLTLAQAMTMLHVTAAADSCFARCAYPQFDSQCRGIPSQDACQVQATCKWGNRETSSCCAKAKGLEKVCESITSEKSCDVQIGCAWRTGADANQWAAAVNTAVVAAKPPAPGSLDADIEYTTILPTTSRAHQVLQSQELDTVLSSWTVLYHLPSDAVNGLRTLVAAESTDFKGWHTSIHADGKKANVSVVVAAGRNWNGQISLAFVVGSANTSLRVKPHNVEYGEIVDKVCGWDCPNGCSDGQPHMTIGLPEDKCTTSQVACPVKLRAKDATTITNLLRRAIYPTLTKESELLEVELRNDNVLSNVIFV